MFLITQFLMVISMECKYCNLEFKEMVALVFLVDTNFYFRDENDKKHYVELI